MGNLIKKTANNRGIFRYIRNVDLALFPTVDWLHDPIITGLDLVPQKFWKYDGTTTVVEMSQAEKDNVNANLIEAEAIPNKTGEFVFGNRGKTSNRWLRSGGGVFMPSDKMPNIFFNDGNMTGLSFVNNKNNADTDVQLYKNNILWYTWEIRTKRYAYKTNDLSALVFEDGDLLSIKLSNAGTTIPVYPLVTVQYKYNLHYTGVGGVVTL